jgi:hypothetical protein
MSDIFGKVSEGSSGFIQPFSSTTYLDGGRDFLNSNSIVAKFSFLILILIGFMFIIRLSVSFMSWGFMPSYTPVLINGMVEAKQMLTFPQDPTVKGSKPIMRSVNDNGGLEFTWSVWIFVDDFSYKQNEYKHIFHKGNDSINSDGRAFPNNGPGLYITPKTNNLLVIMNSFNKIDEEVIIQDLPLNKWVNIIIRVSNQRQLDIYINGTLTKRHILDSVPKQNYGDVFVSMNGGFSGKTSLLQYFSNAIGTNQIQSIVDKGPNMKMLSSDMLKGKPNYLSMRWFLGNNSEI